LPTKKGITLNIDAWDNFKKLVDDVDQAIKPIKKNK